mgnify:CR=1 FL=1
MPVSGAESDLRLGIYSQTTSEVLNKKVFSTSNAEPITFSIKMLSCYNVDIARMHSTKVKQALAKLFGLAYDRMPLDAPIHPATYPFEQAWCIELCQALATVPRIRKTLAGGRSF